MSVLSSPPTHTQTVSVSLCLTLSHCLSLLSRMMTSLGCIWYPSSLNDRFRPSNVTFIRYLQKKTLRKETDWRIYHLLENILVTGISQMSYLFYISTSIQVPLLSSPIIKVLLHIDLFFKHLFWQTQWYCINSSSAKKQLSTNVEPALP